LRIIEALPTISELEIIARLALAALLCGLIGLERERRGQVAGMRTHILVGVGAALFTIISAYAFSAWIVEPSAALRPPVVLDPSRIAAQIVVGIGFLGAGAIITQGVTVRGLTTAATLWMAAALGMATGIGFYFAAVFAAALVFVVLIGVRKIRNQVVHQIRSNIVFVEARVKKNKRLGQLLAGLSSRGIALQRIDPMRKNRYRLEILVPADIDIQELRAVLNELPGVRLRSLRAARSDAEPGE
jgi:putative Mg2+ transporter-C (MgtC) family protein